MGKTGRAIISNGRVVKTLCKSVVIFSVDTARARGSVDDRMCVEFMPLIFSLFVLLYGNDLRCVYMLPV